MSDSLAVMNEGRIEQVGTPEDVYLRPELALRGGLSGRGELDRRRRACGRRRAPVGSGRRSPADRCAAGVVTGSVFLGDCVQVLVTLESGEDTVAQVPRHAARFQPGDDVQFSWSAADEMNFS